MRAQPAGSQRPRRDAPRVAGRLVRLAGIVAVAIAVLTMHGITAQHQLPAFASPPSTSAGEASTSAPALQAHAAHEAHTVMELPLGGPTAHGTTAHGRRIAHHMRDTCVAVTGPTKSPTSPSGLQRRAEPRVAPPGVPRSAAALQAPRPPPDIRELCVSLT